MEVVSLTEARARLSELVDRAAKGEDVTITRRGKPVARIVATEQPRQPIDLEAFRGVREKMPMYEDPDGLSFVERMRSEDRY